MRFGFVYPGSDVKTALAWGQAAEAAGWDAFFMWESLFGTDPWVALGGLAATTQRIRLGTLITPVSRRRPWKLASEVATLDRLSNGRAILCVGLGALETGFADYGEETDRKLRAELVDEGLAIITKLWGGQPFDFLGKHYQVHEKSTKPPATLQQPRVPIWVVGEWPRPKSIERAARYDGLLSIKRDATGAWLPLTPADLAAARAYFDRQHTAPTPFEIVVEGQTPGADPVAAAAQIGVLAAAGATWWIESRWEQSEDAVYARLRQGPPKLDDKVTG